MSATLAKPVRRGPKPRRPIARSTQRIRTRRPAGTVRREAKAAGDLTPEQWLRILDFYFRGINTVACAYCEEPISAGMAVQEHVIPLSKAGAHTAGNVCVSCPRCNLRKGQQTWVPKLRHPLMSPQSLAKQEAKP